MNYEERMTDFIRSHYVDRASEALKAIEQEAYAHDVPIIRMETRELLRVLLIILIILDS